MHDRPESLVLGSVHRDLKGRKVTVRAVISPVKGNSDTYNRYPVMGQVEGLDTKLYTLEGRCLEPGDDLTSEWVEPEPDLVRFSVWFDGEDGKEGHLEGLFKTAGEASQYGSDMSQQGRRRYRVFMMRGRVI